MATHSFTCKQAIPAFTPQPYSITAFCLVKAKFHYTIWFEAGSKLVVNQLRACLQTDSVIEFGFNVYGVFT